jgi:phosphopantetheinyl transferase
MLQETDPFALVLPGALHATELTLRAVPDGPCANESTRRLFFAASDVGLRDLGAAEMLGEELKPDTIQIWHAWLDCWECEEAFDFLTDGERTIANRFRTSEDRSRFIVRRAILRILLGAYLDVGPRAVGIEHELHGKPALGAAEGECTLHFSTSHSASLGFFAFTRMGRIGIDVEKIRPVPDASLIVAKYFNAADRAEWHAAPIEDRSRVFLRIWTKIESQAKAHGLGLRGGALSREVELLTCPRNFSLPGFVGCVAV